MIALWMESPEHENLSPAGESLKNINLIYFSRFFL